MQHHQEVIDATDIAALDRDMQHDGPVNEPTRQRKKKTI
jgi:hypothetical protein